MHLLSLEHYNALIIQKMLRVLFFIEWVEEVELLFKYLIDFPCVNSMERYDSECV